MILCPTKVNPLTEKTIEPIRNVKYVRSELTLIGVHVVDSRLALGHIKNQ